MITISKQSLGNAAFCISSKKQPVFESVAHSETAVQTTTVLWKKNYIG